MMRGDTSLLEMCHWVLTLRFQKPTLFPFPLSLFFLLSLLIFLSLSVLSLWTRCVHSAIFSVPCLPTRWPTTMLLWYVEVYGRQCVNGSGFNRMSQIGSCIWLIDPMLVGYFGNDHERRACCRRYVTWGALLRFKNLCPFQFALFPFLPIMPVFQK